MFKILGMFSIILSFTGISLVSLSALHSNDRIVIAQAFFKGYPLHLSLLD